MSPCLFDQIRDACAEVSRRASHVRIDPTRIESYARSLPISEIQTPQIDPRYHFSGPSEDRLSYLITLDAINFGSGYFPVLQKRNGLSGYFTIALSLKEHFEADGPFGATDLGRLTAEDCIRIFGQEPAKGACELMELFAASLNDLGGFLENRHGGSFAALVDSVDESAERLVQLLSEMSFFRDVAVYQDLDVPFYKRAQITAADLHMTFEGEGFGRFRDIDRLTIFADNLVPHVLRRDGVLSYEEGLSEDIDAGRMIPSGSSQEIEIRASAVHAVELIVHELCLAGHEVTSRELDNLLWHRGQDPEYKAYRRHRTRCVYY